MADKLFYPRRWTQQEPLSLTGKRHPSPIELGGMRKRIEEAIAYEMLSLERLILPISISAPLQRAIGDLQSVLESIQLQQSEAADIEDKQQ